MLQLTRAATYTYMPDYTQHLTKVYKYNRAICCTAFKYKSIAAHAKATAHHTCLKAALYQAFLLSNGAGVTATVPTEQLKITING